MVKLVNSFELIVNQSVDCVLKQLNDITITNNLFTMGIFPSDSNKTFSGKVSIKSKLFLLNDIFDCTNPLITIKIYSDNHTETVLRLKILPNPVFLVADIIFTISFFFLAFLIFFELIVVVDNHFINHLCAQFLLCLIGLINIFLCMKSMKVSKKVRCILNKLFSIRENTSDGSM